MLEHISEEALKKYKEKSLSATELLYVYDHLESCQSCRDRLAETASLDTLFASFSSEFDENPENLTPHLLPDEIIAYVDSQLEDVDREIADSHLMSCALCRTDIQDLHAFKASLPVQPVKPELPEKQVGLGHKFLLFWHQSGWGLAIQAAALATIAFFFMTTLYLKKEVSGLHGTLSELHQKNDELQKQVEDIPELRAEIAQLQRSDSPSIVGDGSVNTDPLNDNGRQVAIKQGSFSGIEALPSRYEQLLKSVLSQQRVRNPSIPEELRPPGNELSMGADNKESFQVLSPAGKIIESERPTLNWKALEGARSYSVAVYDADSNQVAQSPKLSTTAWTVSESLKRGVVYSWEVTAIKDDKEEVIAPSFPAPPARFKVLGQAKFDELNSAKRTYNSHLLSGTLYAQAGLLDDAEREFKALLAANPKSKLAQKLLRSVQGSKPQKH